MSTRLKVFLALGVVVIVGAAAGAWWFLRDDSPPPVTLQQAVDAANSASDGASSGSPTSGTGIAGTWTVDASTTSSDLDAAEGTFAGFRIGENLANVGSTTAVGRTGDVTGTLTIADSKLTAAKIEVDVTDIETDRSQRKSKIYQALDAGRFPTATFVLTQPLDLPANAASGTAVAVTATGELTIHGVTKSVQIPLQAQLVKNRVAVVGSIELTFADYDVAVPQSPIVVSADDHGTLEFQLLFVKG